MYEECGSYMPMEVYDMKEAVALGLLNMPELAPGR